MFSAAAVNYTRGLFEPVFLLEPEGEATAMPTHSRKRQIESAHVDEDEDSSGPSKRVKSTVTADVSAISPAGDLAAARDADGNEYWEVSSPLWRASFSNARKSKD